MFDRAPRHAIVVDDNPVLLIHAADIVTDAGFQSLEASNVEEALVLLERYTGRIDLLFTDVKLGDGRDGFDLAREAAARWPSLSILVTSGAVAPTAACLPDGAVFVRKPFSVTAIQTCLETLCAQ